jgi:prepilin-type N-terminal cleavage/methylation domain-containing protein
MKKNGFTLVELLIVMTIVVILAMIAISIFNASGVLNKARDAQRKKDLSRIKVAFEEYFNDKGCYPSETEYVSELNKKTNCQTNIFSQWLSIWPCDPNKTPYTVIVEGTCPKSYKVVAILENKNDSTLDVNKSVTYPITIGPGVTLNPAHYGVTSSNVNLFEKYVNPRCAENICYYKTLTVDTPNWQTNTIMCVKTLYTLCAKGATIDDCLVDCCQAGKSSCD